ncbi:MAG TPA: aminotransferase class V-fold PLP-dependent enzyme, partial [Bacteroidota bacterium]|nr:aminotransferase class V-fold PLP-dependent enzyme [Bacteroidota bacterium]
TLGAMPKRVLDTVTKSMTTIEETLAQWDYRAEHPDWFTGYRPYEEVRTPLAKIVGCDVGELSLAQNATMGMNFIANGIELQPGDEVLQTDQEHPGGKCGWDVRVKRSGAVWKSVAIPTPPNDKDEIINRFRAAINSKTRVLAIPHQTSMLGLVMPVKELIAIGRTQGHPNIFIVLDGAQAAGQVDVNLATLGCDAYFFSPHKWLLAPPGSGALFVKKERLKEIWTTLASASWSDDKNGSYRLMQFGTGNRSIYEGIQAAAEFRLWLGPERVARRIHALGTRLRDGLQQIKGVTILSSVNPDMAAGITTYRVDGMKGGDMMDAFWAKKYRVRSMGDTNGVRHSLHIYNSMQDVDRGLEIVNELAKNVSMMKK